MNKVDCYYTLGFVFHTRVMRKIHCAEALSNFFMQCSGNKYFLFQTVFIKTQALLRNKDTKPVTYFKQWEQRYDRIIMWDHEQTLRATLWSIIIWDHEQILYMVILVKSRNVTYLYSKAINKMFYTVRPRAKRLNKVNPETLLIYTLRQWE